MNETPLPQPLIEQEAATSVKWGGAAIVLFFILAISFFVGPGTALLTLGACFGTLMFCVGLEAEEGKELAQ